MRPWVSRAIVVILDGVGVGALPDARLYGDAGCHTLAHALAQAPVELPVLASLGLGNLAPLTCVPPTADPHGACGRLVERAAGKDSTVGHWELFGVVAPRAFPVYPHGFPEEIIAEFSARTGRGVLGNRPASGTAIIEELYPAQAASGDWIVYTSGDSVFQVAAHEDVIPPEELYAACRVAAGMLLPVAKVLRVIARPFAGAPGELRRTPGRRDYNPEPPGITVLDRVSEASLPVVTVGKVDRVFAGRGVTDALHTAGNRETLGALRREMDILPDGLMIANLVDTDMLYGHRRDPIGFTRALAEFDKALGLIIGRLRPRDVLVLAADHGCDPCAPGTDHTREYAPMLWTGPLVRDGVDLGVRSSFADLGATICEALGLLPPESGQGFWADICRPPRRSTFAAERDAWLHRWDHHGVRAGVGDGVDRRP